MKELTPIVKYDDIYVKRDDIFEICGVRGGKARSAYQIIDKAISDGYNTFVTAGSRMSPQCEIVSAICQNRGYKCHLFMPSGKETSVISHILQNNNSTIHHTKVGYNSVLLHESIKYAETNGFFYIPFGMECIDNIEITKHQVKNIPDCVKRIVVPCGSGMSMISIIKGLQFYKKFDKRVLGVIVGKKPYKTFDRFIKNDLFESNCIKYDFVESELDYGTIAKKTKLYDIELDPIYESKCIPFLKNGDLLWIVGKRL